MYPLCRMSAQIRRAKRMPEIGFFDLHECDMRVYPWDLDIFFELNNGRTLTLYDIPRVSLAYRTGLWGLIKKKKIGMTVAGITVQYRKRITVFQKLRISAQCIGIDERFVYILQNIFRDNIPCGQALVRMAFVKGGILSPLELIEDEFGKLDVPELPEWVQNYVQAAALRPWPPESPL